MSIVEKLTAPMAAACVLVVSCSPTADSAAPATVATAVETTAEPDGGESLSSTDRDLAEEIETTIDGAMPGLRETVFFATDPYLDLSSAVSRQRSAAELLGELGSALPAPDEFTSGEIAGAHRRLLEALVGWEEGVTRAADELSDRSDELAPMGRAWVEAIEAGDDVPPPRELSELVNANPDGADRFGQACSEFADVADVAPDCFGAFGDPDAASVPGADVAEGASVEATLGAVTVAIDGSDAAETQVVDDLVLFDIGPATSLRLSTPPPVRDPDGGAESTMDWPEDPGRWLEDLGADVVTDETVELGSRPFRHLAFTVGEPTLLIVDDRAGAPLDTQPGATHHLWEGEIEGQSVVAVLDLGIPEEADLFVDVAEYVLGSIVVRSAGG